MDMNEKPTREESFILLKAGSEKVAEGKITTKCPRCGGVIDVRERGTASTIYCKTPHCIQITGRGI